MEPPPALHLTCPYEAPARRAACVLCATQPLVCQDLLHWCTGWVDWNLILDTTGGPNHLGNRCDANIIADPDKTEGFGTLVMQASYYVRSLEF